MAVVATLMSGIVSAEATETPEAKTARILEECKASNKSEEAVAACMIEAGEMSPLPNKQQSK